MTSRSSVREMTRVAPWHLGQVRGVHFVYLLELSEAIKIHSVANRVKFALLAKKALLKFRRSKRQGMRSESVF